MLDLIEVCHTVAYTCFGCSALPPRFSELIYRCIVTSKNTITHFNYNRIEIKKLVGGVCTDIEDLV